MSDAIRRTPEEAILADSGIPARDTHIVAVMYSPKRDRALVFVEYGEPPNAEPYVVLCDRDGDHWTDGAGSSGSQWMWTHDDDAGRGIGVRIVGWDPPEVRWDVPDPWSP